VEKNVKLTLPAAFWEYIEEIAVKQRGWKDVNEYCSENLTQAMIAHLDGDQIILLPSKKYMIPRAIAFQHNEIMEHYTESYRD
jgi:hypothetical protein